MPRGMHAVTVKFQIYLTGLATNTSSIRCVSCPLRLRGYQLSLDQLLDNRPVFRELIAQELFNRNKQCKGDLLIVAV